MQIDKIQELPIYKNKKEGEFLVKKDIVDNFPNNFGITENENDNIEYATTSGTTSNRMEIIRPKGWWQENWYEICLCHCHFLSPLVNQLCHCFLTKQWLKYQSYQCGCLLGCRRCRK